MRLQRYVTVGCLFAIGGAAWAQGEPAKPAAATPPAGGGKAEAAPDEKAAPATSGAPAAPAEVPAPTPGVGGGTTDQGAYTVRLRSLEKNVNELKEQIFRTKARLNLLKETVLGGVLGASRLVIKHKNEMGSTYRLIQAVYALDGVQIYGKTDDSGRLAEMAEFDVYNGAVPPGSHTLTVVLTYQGSGFGVFSYLKGYKWTPKSSHTFVAGEGKSTSITVVGFEKGNVTTDINDRPAIDFKVNVMAAEGGSAAAKK